jgi:hypothetical protein
MEGFNPFEMLYNVLCKRLRPKLLYRLIIEFKEFISGKAKANEPDG